jgi:hypothetical protein
MVFLRKDVRESVLAKSPRVERLQEKPPVILKHARLD